VQAQTDPTLVHQAAPGSLGAQARPLVQGRGASEGAAVLRDLASPEETRARLHRIQIARLRESERAREVSDAFATLRKYGPRSSAEFLQRLQVVHSSIAQPILDDLFARFASELLEMATDLDGELNGLALEDHHG
jgi:hypothetical protein